MRSSSGQYFAGLDHVRAVAAFLVVFWHFAHSTNGAPVPFGAAPEIALLDEGHVGVALFMVLSGYLFAKLLDGRDIVYGAFIWSRLVRLLPLLLVVLVLTGVEGALTKPDFQLSQYLERLAWGWIRPTLPNGGWSITAELHFYLILPLLLWGARHKPLSLLLVVVGAIATRLAVFALTEEIQPLSYFTIFGRIDQFVMGILAFNFRARMSGWLALAGLVTLAGVYAWFDTLGGWSNDQIQAVWIGLPTVEAVCFASMIAWYDKNPLTGRWTWPLQKAGEYSYEVYLLHFYFVFRVANQVDIRVMDISNIYVALLWAAPFFAGMVMIGAVAFRVVEKPFFRLRRSYIKASKDPEASPLSASASASQIG